MTLTIQQEQTTILFEQKKRWSVLDPRPVIFYYEEVDTWCVYWFGMFMIYEHALIVASIKYFAAPPSKEMTEQADYKFSMLFHSGYFDIIKTPEFVNIYDGSNLTSYYLHHIATNMIPHNEVYTPEEVWGWFAKRYESG